MLPQCYNVLICKIICYIHIQFGKIRRRGVTIISFIQDSRAGNAYFISVGTEHDVAPTDMIIKM